MIAGLALATAVAVSGFWFARRALLLARLVRMGTPPASSAATAYPTASARRPSWCSVSASCCSGWSRG